MPTGAWLRARAASQGPVLAGLVLALAAGTGLGLGLGRSCTAAPPDSRPGFTSPALNHTTPAQHHPTH